MSTTLAKIPAQIGASLGHGSITFWEPELKAKLWIVIGLRNLKDVEKHMICYFADPDIIDMTHNLCCQY